jgi:hypothetical protein
MIRRRDLASSSLAFIDVMACGLGSVLLLFILMDFGEVMVMQASNEIDNTDNSDYYRIQDQNNSLEREINLVQDEITQIKLRISERILDSARANAELSAYTSATAAASIPEPEPPQSFSQEGDLIGLQIEGEKILILLDSSASMSDEQLIKVLTGIADSSGDRLRNGAKWLQAKKIVNWIVDNAPESSGIKILSYSDSPKLLNSTWSIQQNLSPRLAGLLSAERPLGSTNLESALDYVNDNISDYSTIYLITDGLPTKAAGSTRLRNIRSCGVSVGRSVPQVSGECREAIFQAATTTLIAQNKKIHVILLPFEGDPRAAPLYYKWVTENRGMLLTPDRAWP